MRWANHVTHLVLFLSVSVSLLRLCMHACLPVYLSAYLVLCICLPACVAACLAVCRSLPTDSGTCTCVWQVAVIMELEEDAKQDIMASIQHVMELLNAGMVRIMCVCV